MMRKVIVPALSMVALGMPSGFVPTASALEHAQFDCGFETVAQESVTGGQDTFTGAAYGFIVSPTPGESVSIQCWVRVDGDRVDETATGSGTQAATTQGQVTYTASDTQDVDLCADWSAGSESGSICFETTTTTIPPQEVLDLIADTTAAMDPIVCGAQQTLGAPGVVNGTGRIWIDPDDCDVWLICPPDPPGERIIDYVPYHDPYNGPDCDE